MDRGRCIAGDWRVSEVASVWETLVERALLSIKTGGERAEHWPLGVGEGSACEDFAPPALYCALAKT